MKLYRPYLELLNQSHILIAGTTGSGKSVLLNGLIKTITAGYNPAEKQLILIDLKRVELIEYKKSPHTACYISEVEAVPPLFDKIVCLMRERFFRMQSQGLKKTSEPHIYIVIDEYADIKLNCTQAEKNISLIATQGRATGIHLVIATQRPTRDIVTPLLKCNCDCKIALRAATQQESRNIINTVDAVNLPRVGKAIFSIPGEPLQLFDVPLEAVKP